MSSNKNKKFRIEGKVLNRNSKPIPKVIISILDSPNKVISDINGEFQFKFINPGNYILNADCRGFEITLLPITLGNSDLKNIIINLIPLSKYNKFKTWLKSFTGILTTIITLISVVGIPLIIKQTKNEFRSPQEESDSKYYLGELKPKTLERTVQRNSIEISKMPDFTKLPKVNKNDGLPIVKGLKIPQGTGKPFGIMAGNLIKFLNVDTLRDGRYFNLKCENEGMKLGVLYNDGKMYFSTSFYDIFKNQLIGELEFNRWKVYKEHYDYPQNTEYKLEIKDSKGYIAFSAEFLFGDKIDVIKLNGYFLRPSFISIIDAGRSDYTIDTCLSTSDPNWLSNAEAFIEKIHTIFPKTINK